MKKYLVSVNGTKYEVEIEEIAASEATASAPAASVSSEAAAPSGSAGITAPMPGNILAVNVTGGAKVKKGDVLMVLEAMKMENEILAPSDGTVTSVNVSKGSTVETGALLCTIA